jgi:hypothetical protein
VRKHIILFNVLCIAQLIWLSAHVAHNPHNLLFNVHAESNYFVLSTVYIKEAFILFALTLTKPSQQQRRTQIKYYGGRIASRWPKTATPRTALSLANKHVCIQKDSN